MAIARFVLKTLPGIDRPAIASQLPTRKGVDHRARPRRQRQLHARAAAAVRGDGQRARRGRRGHRAPDRRASSTSARRRSRATTSSRRRPSCCAQSGLNFHGNVEGDDIYKGTTDVVVCDGFVGNVALKTSEGLAKMLYDFLQDGVHAQPADAQLAAIVAYPVLMRVQAPHRPAPLQRRDADRPQGRRRQEPRRRRRLAFAHALRKAYAEVDARRARPHRAADGGDAGAAHRGRAPRSRPHGARRHAMHSRIAGTGRYLPAQVAHQRRPRGARRHERRVDPRAHRHPRSATSPPTTKRRRDLALARVARTRSRRPASPPADVDLIIVATTTPDMVFPSTACIAAGKLGAHGGAAFDVQAVCSGFVYALAIADRMVAGGHGAQRARRRRRDLFAHPRLERPRHVRAVRRRRRRGGAGAVATTPGILSAHLHADGSHRDILCVPGTVRNGAVTGTPFLHMDGAAVFKFAVRVLAEVAHEALDANGMTRGGHRLADSAPGQHPHHGCDREEAAACRSSESIVTVDRHANTSAASIPLALDVAVRDGRIQRGPARDAARASAAASRGARCSCDWIMKTLMQASHSCFRGRARSRSAC